MCWESRQWTSRGQRPRRCTVETTTTVSEALAVAVTARVPVVLWGVASGAVVRSRECEDRVMRERSP
jgi:hypothetical protein